MPVHQLAVPHVQALEEDVVVPDPGSARAAG